MIEKPLPEASVPKLAASESVIEFDWTVLKTMP